MAPLLRLILDERLTLGAFERILAAHGRAASLAKHVEFDLRKTTFVGHFPATLFYSWCLSLSERKTRVSILLPSAETLSPQMQKALLGCGVLSSLREAGVELDFAHMTPLPSGVPLTVLHDREQLWTFIEGVASMLLGMPLPQGSDPRVILEALDVVLFELAENAFMHTDGSRPHFQLTLSESSGSSGPEGFIAIFEPGTPYVEICLGDLGPGIDRRLATHLPNNYKPLYAPRRGTKAHKILSYAFEFSATSDKAGRRDRLSQLIAADDLNPDDVASGLFCVVEVAKARRGQLVVRTPRAMLSIDFSADALRPRVTGRTPSRVTQMHELPGSHFLIRLPLRISPTPELSNKRPSVASRPAYTSEVSIVPVFQGARYGETVGDMLHRASIAADEHFNRFREKPGFSVFMPAPLSFPSRAVAAFLGVLSIISHGRQTCVWLDPRARTSAITREPSRDDKKRRFRSRGQPILIGDLTVNAFAVPFGAKLLDPGGLLPIEGQPGAFMFEDRVFQIIQEKYAESLQNGLRGLLRSPAVRHHPGPFLIEGKYYRDVFFEIPRLLADPSNVEYVSEWSYRQIPSIASKGTVDALVGTAHLLNGVLERLADLIERSTGRRPAVICRTETDEGLWIVKRLLMFHDKRAVIMTDVISTGQSLNRVIAQASGLTIDVVLTMVDARKEDNGAPFVFRRQAPFAVPLSAILAESVTTHDEPPPSKQPHPGEERVYVIDRGTRAPTLYVRRTTPHTSIIDLLETTVRQSQSLLAGHIQAEFKHYLNCLHFPRLFSALRREIETWIEEQFTGVSRELGASAKDQWFVGIYSPDGSLDWLPPTLEVLPQKPKVTFITREELEAPPLPKSREGHDVLIIPAIASGAVARRAIEFGSRFSPKSLLLLSILSRMEANELSFLLQIQRYAEARLRLGVCFEFPLPAYATGLCPACAEVEKLEQLKALLGHSSQSVSRLTRNLDDKVNSLTLVDIDSLKGDEGTVPVSSNELVRARLLALYTQARFQPERGEELSECLQADDAVIDHFLALIGRHRYSVEFSVAEISRRTFRACEALEIRARVILDREGPPFRLGPLLAGIVHIAKHAFHERAADLLRRYGSSLADIEEICAEMLTTGSLPADIASAIENLHSSGHEAAEAVATETVKYLRDIQTADEAKNARHVDDLSYLFAKLLRSSHFTISLSQLINQTADPKANITGLLVTSTKLVHHWNDEILVPLSSIRTSKIWQTLERDRGEGPLRIEPLEAYISQLRQLTKHAAANIQEHQSFRLRVGDFAKVIHRFANNIGSRIQRCFVNVLHCQAVSLPRVISDVTGKALNVISEVDRQIDLAFCDLDDLNDVTSELVTNWQTHGKDSLRRDVSFRLFQEPGHVVLEFGDTFGGAFDQTSLGGLLVAKEFCDKYCATLRIQTVDETGRKSIAVVLRRFAQPSWKPDNE